MWYYGQEENDLNISARIVLHMLLALHYFQRGRMNGIGEFQSVVLNLENERRMQGKEMERNRLAHKWFLTCATMPTIVMLKGAKEMFTVTSK